MLLFLLCEKVNIFLRQSLLNHTYGYIVTVLNDPQIQKVVITCFWNLVSYFVSRAKRNSLSLNCSHLDSTFRLTSTLKCQRFELAGGLLVSILLVILAEMMLVECSVLLIQFTAISFYCKVGGSIQSDLMFKEIQIIGMVTWMLKHNL